MRKLFFRFSIFLFLPFNYAQTAISYDGLNQKTAAADYLGLDMVELVGGRGEQTDHARLALHWNLGGYSLFRKELKFSLAASFALYNLTAQNSRGTSQLRDLGLTPTVLYRFNKAFWGLRPFMEGGIGFHYLTEKDMANKELSTHFQFGDQFSLGVEFGKRLNYRINYQFQHLSNGGIESPNPGINFHLLSFGAQLR